MTDNTVVQNVAMKAIIVNDGKILLLRESAEHDTNTKAGKYQFPGGRIDPGEPFADGLRREIKEETGMEVEIGEPFYVGEWFPVIKGAPHHIVAVFLICKPSTTEVVISEEHDAYEWADPEVAQKIDIMMPDRIVVEQYFAQLRDISKAPRLAV